MTEITVKDLQDIAVDCVSGFFNHGTSLSAGLCKVASERSLNSEQLKRAVEVTNTLAHLHATKTASDRTVEFPLADYPEIVKMASLPEGFMEDNVPAQPAQPAAAENNDGLDKKASADMGFQFDAPTIDQLGVLMVKEAAANENALQYALGNADAARQFLIKAASDLKADQYALEALSATAKDDEQFIKLARLVWGKTEEKTRCDFASDLKLPRQSLEKAASVRSHFEQAIELLVEIEHRREFAKQAAEIRDLEKQAILGAIGVGIGRMVGSAAFAPFKMIGKGLGNRVVAGSKAIADRTHVGVNNALWKTKLGDKMGLKHKTLKPETLRTGKRFANTVATLGALGDAALYNPKKDKVTGESSDVFDSLY